LPVASEQDQKSWKLGFGCNMWVCSGLCTTHLLFIDIHFSQSTPCSYFLSGSLASEWNWGNTACWICRNWARWSAWIYGIE
jgi:hypothetical protein